MNIKVTGITIKNYKGIASFAANLFQRTKICGRNALGKTTISDAFFDILTGKLSDGSATDSIMPHDADGNRIDHVDAYRAMTVEIGGVSHEIEKITKQKWVKPRGESEEHFEGTETVYTIDGFDKKKKDYDAWVTENIADQETLLLCSNAQPFLNILKKSTAEARKLLEKLAGFDVAKVIESDEHFARVQSITKGHPIEEVIKQLKKNLSQQKKSLESAQNNLVYENSREVAIVDTESLELEHKATEQELKSIIEEESSYQSRIQATEDKADELASLIAKKSSLVAEKKKIISESAENVRKYLDAADVSRSVIESSKRDIASREAEIKDHQNAIESLKKQYEAEIAKTYNGETTCPVCKQPLPSDMIASATEKFEAEKKRSVDEIIKRAQARKDVIAYLNEAIAEKKTVIGTAEASIADFEKKAQDAETAPEDPRLGEIRAEIAGADAEIENLKRFLDGMSDISGKKAEWANKKSAHINKLAEIKYKIDHAQDGIKQKESIISRLNESITAEAQKCADIEADIALIERFSLAKNGMLAEEVNRHFQHFQFVFTETTIDGNINETLKLVVNGTPYQNLNGGDRKLAEIDLVRGLQEMNGLCMPIISDEANTIDPWRIPKTEQQLIVIMRSDISTIDVEELVG